MPSLQGLSLKAQGPAQYSLLTIPRARRVRQSLLTTPSTALVSLLSCVYHITVAHLSLPFRNRPPFADVLILNGPGTCFTLCIAVYVNKVRCLVAQELSNLRLCT